MSDLELRESRARDKLLRAVSDYVKTTGWSTPASQAVPWTHIPPAHHGIYAWVMGFTGNNYQLVVTFTGSPNFSQHCIALLEASLLADQLRLRDPMEVKP